jgi:flagellar basal body rod protein FlgB
MNGFCQVNPLVVRRFAPSNMRMKSAARCCRREASGNNVKISGERSEFAELTG